MELLEDVFSVTGFQLTSLEDRFWRWVMAVIWQRER